MTMTNERLVALKRMGLRGPALVRELEERDMAVRVLMLTGHPLDYETSRALPKSVVGWVVKPPSLEQLAEAVAQALARSESAKSA